MMEPGSNATVNPAPDMPNSSALWGEARYQIIEIGSWKVLGLRVLCLKRVCQILLDIFLTIGYPWGMVILLEHFIALIFLVVLLLVKAKKWGTGLDICLTLLVLLLFMVVLRLFSLLLLQFGILSKLLNERCDRMRFLTYCLPPPRKFIRSSYKGSAVLALVIVCGIFSAMIGLASAKVSSVTNSSLSSSKTSAQALQYAETQADIVRNTAYDDLSSKAKTQIAGTHFYEEVTVGAETAYKEDIQKKDCTVNVYSGSETIPRATLTITRLTKEENQASGVPVGTVITWASLNDPNENGTWLECNGQSCTAYPDLVKVLGSYTVPDYRGVFLRGLGSVTSKHYGTVQHQSNGLGELQGDAIRDIDGQFVVDDLVGSGTYHNTSHNGVFKAIASARYNAESSDKTWTGFWLKFDAAYVVPTSNEDRPINRAVRYFIKAA